jgi:hypothetical protein
MELPVAKLRRLIGAFESLLGDQSHLLQADDAVAMLAAQERSKPVFDEIMVLSRQSDVVSKLTTADRTRVTALIKSQNDLFELLETKKKTVRVELDNVTGALSRTYELRTVYGAYRAPARSFSTASLA